MYTNRDIEKLTQAVEDIIFPKYNKYLENKKNSKEITDQIEDLIEDINKYEDFINDSMLTELPDNVFKNYIGIGGYIFMYDDGEFTLSQDKLEYAKSIIYNNNNLVWYDWTINTKLHNRIQAIIITTEEVDFPDLVTIVENNIKYEEFITKQ